MTMDLFNKGFLHFNAHYTAQVHKVLLPIDNCSAHGNSESLRGIKNGKVYYLTPNTNSKIQPYDAAIIAATKHRYWSFQMERAVD